MSSNSVWSVHVLNLDDGREFESSSGGKFPSLIPGSSTKTFITGAVLDSDFRNDDGFDIGTILRHDDEISGEALKGNLYLAGSGDALLSLADLKSVAEQIAKSQIKRIAGDLVVDDSLFHTDDLERAWTGAGHAPAGALGLDLHTVAVVVSPTGTGQAPNVTIEPFNAATRFANAARTVEGGIASLRIERLDDLSYRIDGNIQGDSGPLRKRFALSNPAVFAGGVLKTMLEEAGIQVEGVVKRGKTPAGTKLIAEIPGRPLDEMLRDMNFHSLNVVADNLLLALGAKRFGLPGTREKGARTVEEFLRGLGLPMDEVAIYDGSGLSDKNRVTTRFMVHYLLEVTKKPWFERFRNTLPRPGIEGTVQTLGFRDDRFRVKSGRLENVYTLAGYGVDGAGKDVAFCFIVNGPGVGILPNMDEVGADVLRSIAGEKAH